MDHGSVFRRCGCRDGATGRLLGARCPELSSRRHGTWYFSADLPSPAGDRRRVRRGGFTSRSAAIAAMEALLGTAPGRAQNLRTGEWLDQWLASRVSLRASTSRGYAAHVRVYLVPYLGGIPLAELSPGDVQGMFGDHPRRGSAGPSGQRSDAAADPCHLARGAECRRPRRADLSQSRPVA
jgi:hypothetical protein